MRKLVPEILRENIIKDVFETHYPQGKLSAISIDDIPKNTLGHFEHFSKRFIPPGAFTSKEFDSSFHIRNYIGSAYAVTHEKIYATKPFSVEKIVYVANAPQRSEDVLLYSQIRFNITDQSEFYHNKPFVGLSGCSEYVFHEDNVLSKVWIDLGVDQLLMLNALSFALFGLPVHSDTIIDSYEKPLWEELSKNGLAREYTEVDSHTSKLRYVFDKKPVRYRFQQN